MEIPVSLMQMCWLTELKSTIALSFQGKKLPSFIGKNTKFRFAAFSLWTSFFTFDLERVTIWSCIIISYLKVIGHKITLSNEVRETQNILHNVSSPAEKNVVLFERVGRSWSIFCSGIDNRTFLSPKHWLHATYSICSELKSK